MVHELASSTDGAPASTAARRRRRWPMVVIVALAAALLAAAAWRAWPHSAWFYTDGRDLRVPMAAAHLREVLWRDPVPLPPAINLTDDDYEPSLTDDGSMLFFVRGRTGGTADIFSARRTGDEWGEPAAVTQVNSDGDDLGPRISRDGLTLYFYSDRPGGAGGYDLWASRRATPHSEFSTPFNLGTETNSPWDDYGPAPAPEETLLYFASNRPHSVQEPAPGTRWSATVRETRDRRGYDLYAAPITPAGFGPAHPLSALNTPFDEGTPAVSPVGDFLYFSSNRPGGAGGFDLHRVRIIPGGFGAVERIGDAVNTAANELDPALSMGGFALHFSSDRQAPHASRAGGPHYDIYHTTSREVFTDTETLQAGFDWDGLWSVLVPGLLALLFLLLLLLLGGPLWNAAQRRRLSLIMRCLLASLLLHTLLLALLTVWQVSTSLSGLFKRPGGVRVALTSAARAEGMTEQVRGGFSTPLESAEPVEAALRAPVEFVRTAFRDEALKPPERSAIAAGLDGRSPTVTDAPLTAMKPEPIAGRSLTSPPPELSALPAQLPPAPRRLENVEAPVATATVVPASQPTTRAPLPGVAPEPHVASTGLALARTEPMETAELEGLTSSQSVEDARSAAPPRAHQPHAPVPDLAAAAPNLALPTASAPGMSVAESPTASVRSPSQPGPRPALHQPAPPAPQDAASLALAVRPTTIHAEPQSELEHRAAQDAAIGMAPRVVSPTTLAALAPAPVADPPLADLPVARAQASTAPEPAARPAVHPSLSVLRPPMQAGRGLAASIDSVELPALAPSRATAAQAVRAGTVSDARSLAPRAASVVPQTLPRLADGPLALPNVVSPPSPTPIVTGIVQDAHTGAPLSGAQVRLDLADDATMAAPTDEAGAYALTIPAVPDFFVISASADGYLPASANVSAEAVRGSDLAVHFHLRRADLGAVAIEAAPDVHHLGDDRFEGSVNSQFQKPSEGSRYSASFELDGRQVAPYMTGGRLVMLTRGVQMPHPVYLNGRPLGVRLGHSPANGSFGEFSASIDVGALRAGTNTLEIRALSRGSDIDDFEFVNVQIRLEP